MRVISLITGSPSLYFSSIRSCATPGRSCSAAKPRMKPSRFSTSSTFARSCEAGAVQFAWRARCALRMRVSISPRGSESDICPFPPLPARLDHAGNLSLAGEIAQRDAAQLELAVVAARTPGDGAAQTHPHRRAVTRQLRELQRRVEALLHRERAIHHHRLQRGTLGLVALGHVFALGIPIDLRRLSHRALFTSGTCRPRIKSGAEGFPKLSW